MQKTLFGEHIAPAAFNALLVGSSALILFLAIPWILAACRAAGMPAWVYGAVPMVGWLRAWELPPVWLLLIALIALCGVAMRSTQH